MAQNIPNKALSETLFHGDIVSQLVATSANLMLKIIPSNYGTKVIAQVSRILRLRGARMAGNCTINVHFSHSDQCG